MIPPEYPMVDTSWHQLPTPPLANTSSGATAAPGSTITTRDFKNPRPNLSGPYRPGHIGLVGPRKKKQKPSKKLVNRVGRAFRDNSANCDKAMPMDYSRYGCGENACWGFDTPVEKSRFYATGNGESLEDGTFTLFPKLPPEIRVMIWTYAISDLVSLSSPIIKQIAVSPFMCKEPPPALLHVNHESRYEALRVFTPLTITFQVRQAPLILFFYLGVNTLVLEAGPEIPLIETTGCCLNQDFDIALCPCTSSDWLNAISAPPCHHKCLACKQIHLVNRFLGADTSTILKLKLRLHKCQECRCLRELGQRLKYTFPHLRYMSIVEFSV
jgi:hypothetical protein